MREELTVNIDERMLVPTVETEDALAFSPGRYRLCFEVASGGMATVYLALYSGPLGFERAVAVKTIHRHLAKEQAFVEMFLDEARIAAHVDHPFVCKVMDFGEARESYYLAMEYLVGEPLSTVWEALQEKPGFSASRELPVVFARVIADLAEGLHAAHELTEGGKPVGIVHRDVTPANLFVLFDGTVRVVDFGIATAQNKLHQTETGMVKGKYAYLSPEQLDQRPLDRRSDVFSLGVVFWELLTGKRLFRRDSPMETMQAVAMSKIEAPSSFRPNIPSALDEVVLKALARDPEERYDTARAFALDLEAFIAGEGRAVSRAEVGSWLDELCPGSFKQKRRLVELTRRGETAVPLDLVPVQDAQDANLEPTTVRHREEEKEFVPTDPPPDERESPARDVLDELLNEDIPRTEEGESLTSPASTEPRLEASQRNAPPPARPKPKNSQASAGPRFGPIGGVTQEMPRRRPLLPRILPLIFVVVGVAGGGVLAYLNSDAESGAGADPASMTAADQEGRSSAGAPVAESNPVEGEARGPENVSADPGQEVEESSETARTDDDQVELGTLRVSAPQGGAEIWERGSLLGRTEESISLAPGLHMLELRPYDGSVPQSLPVEIRAGRSVYTSVTLGR